MPEQRRYIVGLISVAGHVILLLAALFFTGAPGMRPPPPDPITVELVPPEEAPPPDPPPPAEAGGEGTPLESTSHGTEMSSSAEAGSASTGRSQARMIAPPSPDQGAAAAAAGGSPLVAPEGDTMPLPKQSPDASVAPPQEVQQTLPDVRERMAAMQMALTGARTAAGADPVSSTPAMLEHDDTAAFRARLSKCTRGPAGRTMDEHAAIVLRVFFKKDGTLAAPPKLLDSSLSVDAVELTKIAVAALEHCQPFAELQADKYRRWKTLDLVVTPLDISE